MRRQDKFEQAYWLIIELAKDLKGKTRNDYNVYSIYDAIQTAVRCIVDYENYDYYERVPKQVWLDIIAAFGSTDIPTNLSGNASGYYYNTGKAITEQIFDPHIFVALREVLDWLIREAELAENRFKLWSELRRIAEEERREDDERRDREYSEIFEGYRNQSLEDEDKRRQQNQNEYIELS